MTIVLGRNLCSLKTSRSGIIPYTVVKDTIYFLMAINKPYGQLCDFGGGIKSKEFALNGGLREFREETSSMFKDSIYTNYNLYENMIAISDSIYYNSNRRLLRTSMLFVPLDNKYIEYDKLFVPNDEVSSIRWISLEDIKRKILNRDEQLWIFIRQLLSPYICDNNFISGLYDSYERNKI